MNRRHWDWLRALLPFYLYSGILCFTLGIGGVLLSRGTITDLFHSTVRQLEAWNMNYRIPWQREIGHWFSARSVPAVTPAVQPLLLGYPKKNEMDGFESWLRMIRSRLDRDFPGWIALPLETSDWRDQNLYRISQAYDQAVFVGINIYEANNLEKPVIGTDLYICLPENRTNLYGPKLAAAILTRFGNGSLRKGIRGEYALYRITWEEKGGIIPGEPRQTDSGYWVRLKATFDTLLSQLPVPVLTDRRVGPFFD